MLVANIPYYLIFGPFLSHDICYNSTKSYHDKDISMLEITFIQLLITFTITWIAIRIIAALRNKCISLKRELQLLLVYICIAVISRFVYFGYHLIDGRLDTLKIGLGMISADDISYTPFYFLFDRYDGWLMNIIGNIAMFIPVGIIWPICFKKLDNTGKTILAGAGYTLLIELSQLFCYGRHTDIDDLILNTTGVAIGAVIVFAIRKARAK